MTEDMSAFTGYFTLLPLSHANVQNEWSVISDICLRLQGQDNLRFGAKLAIGLTIIKEMVSKLYTYVSSNRSKCRRNKWPFSYSDKNFIVPSAHLYQKYTNYPHFYSTKEKRWREAC